MGVKSLWSLLTPVGRPVMLETVEGKAMAIDSSIWIYQFQATMRDKEGRGLVNAHVLGFLRRLSKLLFYGIKPVFVFDGGAPTLKRNTITERKKKKSGAAASHTKIAERLLAAQLRREAVNHVNQSKGKGKAKVTEDPSVVYLDDIDPSAAPLDPSAAPVPKPPTPSKDKKKQFKEHDPYALPNLDVAAAIDKVANAGMGPDHRFATDEELRNFIDEIHPEDLSNMSSLGIDVTSSDFRSLPTDVQYEIIGDLRLKSRQTSYARLDMMLKAAPTPMDFSRQQIKFLKQRNDLTQQLLMTTDNIGTKATIDTQIPVRIASERNKQYVLVKNHGKDGGWILGVKKDEGTLAKPITIDHDSAEEETDGDMDMEEVTIPHGDAQQPPSQPSTTAAEPYHDSDLREYRRSMAMSSIAGRSKSTRKNLAPISRRSHQKAKEKAQAPIPLFEPDPEDPLPVQSSHESEAGTSDGWFDEDEDSQLSYAIQVSLDHPRNTTMPPPPTSKAGPSQIRRASGSQLQESPHLEPSRLETMLSFAGSSPRKVSLQSNPGASQPFPKRVFPSAPPLSVAASTSSTTSQAPTQVADEENLSEEWRPSNVLEAYVDTTADDASRPSVPEAHLPAEDEWAPAASLQSAIHQELEEDNEDMDMEEVPVAQQAIANVDSEQRVDATTVVVPVTQPATFEDESLDEDVFVPCNTLDLSQPIVQVDDEVVEQLTASEPKKSPVITSRNLEKTGTPLTSPITITAVLPTTVVPSPTSQLAEQPEDTDLLLVDAPDAEADGDPEQEHSLSWDAAQEMDPQAEETEFASFLSEVANRNIGDVQKEIDAEIAMLNQQRKAAMRDSEDITQAMINQIMMMLRLFGIPYITAPMEAEAQCAELVALGLVEGVITDDSDVFLFGKPPTGPFSFSEEFTPGKVRPLKVFKNMFNQSKTVEVYHHTDLTRELGLDRGALVRLAYLLGSDYTEGLPGVGPVLAMELLAEFPGDDGLFKFRDWWAKVQTGRDKEDTNTSSFRKRFKKKFKSLYLPGDWPNTAVMDAYYHPTVDSSDEPFKWGLPDLDGLRAFLHSELSWNQGRVDELLLPIIKKMGKRTTATALNRQGTLASYIEGVGLSDANTFSGGSGSARRKTAYASKRLQKIVNDHRKEQMAAKRKARGDADDDETSESVEGEEDVLEKEQPPAKKPRKRAPKATGTAKKAPTKKPAARRKKKQATPQHRGSDDDEDSSRVEFGDSASGSEYEEDLAISGMKKKAKGGKDVGEGSGSNNAPKEKTPPRPKPRPRRKAPAAAPQYVEEGEDAAMLAMEEEAPL